MYLAKNIALMRYNSLSTDGVLLISFKYSILSDPLSLLYVTGTMMRKYHACGQVSRVYNLGSPTHHTCSESQDWYFSTNTLVLSLRTCSWILDLSSNFFKGLLMQSLFKATELRIITLGSNNLLCDLPESKQFH